MYIMFFTGLYVIYIICFIVQYENSSKVRNRVTSTNQVLSFNPLNPVQKLLIPTNLHIQKQLWYNLIIISMVKNYAKITSCTLRGS